ncbi:hypothetical protein JCGZ_11374 [Jatropha curcas]|uniref:Uncharacterized protein n=1 Tax=Jatropha curcas TaxID=180498 RepID=A0A067K7I0_JATCU|nr:hypothetical protein JCGZ_11374 [Jatropha curcas]
MVRVATYFAMSLGAFVFWQSMDRVHVWIALHQDEKYYAKARERLLSRWATEGYIARLEFGPRLTRKFDINAWFLPYELDYSIFRPMENFKILVLSISDASKQQFVLEIWCLFAYHNLLLIGFWISSFQKERLEKEMEIKRVREELLQQAKVRDPLA